MRFSRNSKRNKAAGLFSLGAAAALALIMGPSPVDAAVMSIDYGTDWFKVALVKPGIPLDIVLNAESKRKTQSALNIRGEDRSFGSEALNLATRFPQDSYIGLKRILGRDFNDEHCVDFRNTFTNNMIRDPVRGTAAFETSTGSVYTVEELLAMQFSLAKSQAEETAGEAVKDVVITIPPYFNQFERQAMLDAAELAGLRVLSLIHDETAVALNYAMTRSFPEEQCHIFFDMGAGSTVASLACFQDMSVKDVGKYNKTIQQVDVRAVGYDRTLGGHEFDTRLQKSLADKFQEQKGSKLSVPVVQNERAMAKLLKEANRVKQILSANTETMASVENVMEDVDFKVKYTRQELEDLTTDLIDRVRGPIDAALNSAGMKLSDIQSLVLVGGSVRVPSVQASLAKVVGEEKIAKNVNGDEAAVMGAVFRAASLSRQFKVKEVRLKDISLFPIEVKYTGESKDGSATGGKPFSTAIFKEKSTMGTRKIMSFKRVTDFGFDLQYSDEMSEDLAKEFSTTELAHVSLTGLTEAIQKFKDVSVETPKVKVTIELSDSGILTVQEAVATIETDTSKKASLADKVKSFFGGSETKTEDGAVKEEGETKEGSEETGEKKPDESTAADTKDKKTTAETDGNGTSPKDEKVNDTKAEPTPVPTTKTEKVILKIKSDPRGIVPLTTEAKKEMLAKIKKLDDRDAAKRTREEARNNLESFIYRGRDLLYKDEIIEVSTEEQREALSEKLSEASDWLDEEENAETQEFKDRLTALKKLERPMSFRSKERVARPEAFVSLRASTEVARSLGQQLTEGEGAYHTLEDLVKLNAACDEAEAWATEKETLQASLQLWDELAVTSREIELKNKGIQRELTTVLNKKKPKVVKKKVEKKAEDETATEESKKEGGETTSTEDNSKSSDAETEPKKEQEQSEQKQEESSSNEEKKEEVKDNKGRKDEL